MAWWSKFYMTGDTIATFGDPEQQLRVGLIDDVAVVMMSHPYEANEFLCISIDYLRYYYLSRVFDEGFNESDLRFFAGDAMLIELLDAERVVGILINNNDNGDGELAVQLGYYDADFDFGEKSVPNVRYYTKWKPGGIFNDLRPVRNDLVLTVEAIEGLVSRENLVYKMEIKKPIFPGSATLEVVDVLEGTEAPPRVENSVTYMDGWMPEIGWYLDGCLDWSVPERVGSALMVQSTVTMPFVITTWAEQNNVEIGGSRSTAMTLWGIKAKINEEDFANWNSRIFSKYIGENGKWLTWQPNHMEVDEETPIYMSFLLNRKPTPSKVGVMVQVFDEEGSYHFYEAMEVYNLPENGVINVPMGFKQLGLDRLNETGYEPMTAPAVDRDKLSNYTVWLVDESYGRISRKRNFILDYKRRRNVQHLIFNNSFGGLDAVRMTGMSKTNIGIGGQVNAKGLSVDYKNVDEEIFVRNKKGEKVIELNTGKVSHKWLEYFEELAWSERVLLLSSAGLVALTADKASFDLPGINDFLDSRKFIFKQSKAAVGFSKMPLAITDLNDRPTAWLASQPYCLTDTSTGFRTGMMAYYSLKLHYIDVSPPEAVKGAASKRNEQGGIDYVPPINSATCVAGTAAFENEELVLESTYSKDNCGNGYKGTTWMITVDDGEFGGEDQEAANARALEEYHRRNTQANANLPGNGSCILLQAGLDAEYRNYSVGIESNPDAIFSLAVGASRVDVHINNPQQYLPGGIAGTYYAIEHNGYIKSDWTGNVVLQLEHFAGVRLYVNGVLVINNWTGVGVSECVVPMISGNYYQIKAQYGYKNTGTAQYVLKWRPSGGTTMLVPAYACFR